MSSAPKCNRTPPAEYPRAFWLGLLFWAAVCLAAVLVRGIRWEEGYERAQVILGLTPYPEGHPHYRWVWNGFSVHYYLTGALLWLTRSAAFICGGRQFVATLAIHLPIYGLTWLLARRPLPAHLAMVLSFAGANTIFQSYMPILPWATKATSGIMGMGWAFTVLVALCAGRWRTAGLLFGLMPMIHLGQWPMILLATVAVGAWLGWHGERVALKGLVQWALVGLACCGAFALAQRTVLVPDPTEGAYYSARDGRAIWAEYTTHEDMHRALTDWPRFGPMGHSTMALVGFLILALPFTWREVSMAGQRQPAAVLFAYAFLSAAAIGFARGVHHWTGTGVPYVVVSWMPYRLTIHVSMLLLCGVCAWSCGGKRGGTFWAPLAALGWLAALPLWPLMLPEQLVQRYFSTPETALFLVAGGALPLAWEAAAPSCALRHVWTALAGVGLLALAWYFRPGAAAALCGLAVALSERRFARVPVGHGTAFATALILSAAALSNVFLAEWRSREYLPVSPFEAEMAKYLAAHGAPSDMVLTPLDEHYQMVLERPVVATFETRQFMSYMLSLAATTDKLFADLYGVKDGHWYDWELWKSRTAEEWAALGDAYGFRYVLSKDFYPLHLPERLSGDGLILYEIPRAPGESAPHS